MGFTKIKCAECGRFFGLAWEDGSLPWASRFGDGPGRCSGCADIISCLPRTRDEQERLAEAALEHGRVREYAEACE